MLQFKRIPWMWLFFAALAAFLIWGFLAVNQSAQEFSDQRNAQIEKALR